jgi:DNA-binding transcriptional ArsR family regulator
LPTQTRSSQVFHAVADPTRRAILDQLRRGSRPVNEIARLFPVSRPAISRHLRVLRSARLVREERHGRQRIYRLEAKPLSELDQWLEGYRQFWSANLMSLKTHLEKGKGKS